MAAEPLSWKSLPCRERPGMAVLGGLGVVGVAFLAQVASGSVFLGVVALVLLTGSLHAFFFPTRYLMDEEGVSIESAFGGERRKWEELRAYRGDRWGLTLFGKKRKTLRVLFSGNGEEVLSYVRLRMGVDAGVRRR